MNQFTEDVSDTLHRQLQNVQARTQLEPAAKLAAQQLEILKPIAMIPTANGIAGGPVAAVDTGVILIVLANRKKVVTLHIMPDDTGLLNAIEKSSRHILDEAGKWELEDTLISIDPFVNKFGGKPGKKTPATDPRIIVNMLGMLFAAMPDPERRKIVAGIEECVRSNICPALVGLSGRGVSDTPGSYSGVWPLVILLAPYINTVVG